MQIASTIRDRRAALGITLEQVAQAVGVTKSTVRKWEHGIIQSIGNDKIARLANVLDLPVTALIEETGSIEAASISEGAVTSNELVITVNDDTMSPFILKDDEVYYTTDVQQINDGDVIIVSVKKAVHVRFAYLAAKGIKLHFGNQMKAPEYYPLSDGTRNSFVSQYTGLRILGKATRLVRNL